MRLINRNFARLLYGLIVSSTGDFIFDTTLVLWIGTRLLAGRSYAPAAVSGVLVAVSIGAFTVGPIAGVFVDRWDKRRTMMGSDLIRATLTGLLVIVALLPSGTLPIGVTLGLIYAVVLTSTAASQFFGPSRFALLGSIVETDADRAKASGFVQTAGYTAAIVGPPLAAPLLFTTGVYWALIINAASFVVSFLMIRAIKIPAVVPAAQPVPEAVAVDVVIGEEAQVEQASNPPAAVQPSFRKELTFGYRFVWKTKVMRVFLIAVTIATLGTGALNALDVFFVIDNLHTDPHWYGTLGAAEGIGAIVGTLFAGWLCKRFTDVRVFCLGLATVGVGLVVYSRLGTLWAAIIVLFVLALPLGAVNVSSAPIVLRTVPSELLGRVMSVFGPTQQLAGMLSAVVAGWLVSTVLVNFHHTVAGVTFGRIDTVFVVCGLLIVLGGLYAAIVMWKPEVTAVTDGGAGPVRSDAAEAVREVAQ